MSVKIKENDEIKTITGSGEVDYITATSTKSTTDVSQPLASGLFYNDLIETQKRLDDAKSETESLEKEVESLRDKGSVLTKTDLENYDSEYLSQTPTQQTVESKINTITAGTNVTKDTFNGQTVFDTSLYPLSGQLYDFDNGDSTLNSETTVQNARLFTHTIEIPYFEKRAIKITNENSSGTGWHLDYTVNTSLKDLVIELTIPNFGTRPFDRSKMTFYTKRDLTFLDYSTTQRGIAFSINGSKPMPLFANRSGSGNWLYIPMRAPFSHNDLSPTSGRYAWAKTAYDAETFEESDLKWGGTFVARYSPTMSVSSYDVKSAYLYSTYNGGNEDHGNSNDYYAYDNYLYYESNLIPNYVMSAGCWFDAYTVAGNGTTHNFRLKIIGDPLMNDYQIRFKRTSIQNGQYSGPGNTVVGWAKSWASHRVDMAIECIMQGYFNSGNNVFSWVYPWQVNAETGSVITRSGNANSSASETYGYSGLYRGITNDSNLRPYASGSSNNYSCMFFHRTNEYSRMLHYRGL